MKGSIIKRGSSWLLKYDIGRDPVTGKRQTKYKTVRGTKRDAEAELRKLLNSVEDGLHVNPRKINLADWIEAWLEDYAEPTVSAKTFERYRDLLRLHVIPHFGHCPLQKLTGAHIQSLYTKLRTEGRRNKRRVAVGEVDHSRAANFDLKEGLSERTLLHIHRVLSQCLLEATRSRFLARNPSDDVRAPRPKRGRGTSQTGSGNGEEINVLEAEQLGELLKVFQKKPLFTLVALAAATGMRRGELLGLRWSDVDFDQKKVKIERSVEETRIKGIRLKSTKNRSSKRTIGVDSGVVDILKSHWRRQIEDALKLGRRLPSDALIFPKSPLEPNVPKTPGLVSKEFRSVVDSNGFVGFRFHDLRHTHATLLLSAGVPVNTVAQRLGHSTPVITLTVYGHVLKRSEDKVASAVSDFLGKSLIS
ncbi:MAG: tyrosine-type recombinase/integrase [Bdellovibrionota bacterium]